MTPKKRTAFISFISFFYFFGAAVLLLSLASGTAQEVPIGLRLGIPGVSDTVVIPLLAGFMVLVNYHYFRLTPWGYRLMLIYQSLFGITSLILALQHNGQPYIGNAIWAAMVGAYTFNKRALFTP